MVFLALQTSFSHHIYTCICMGEHTNWEWIYERLATFSLGQSNSLIFSWFKTLPQNSLNFSDRKKKTIFSRFSRFPVTVYLVSRICCRIFSSLNWFSFIFCISRAMRSSWSCCCFFNASSLWRCNFTIREISVASNSERMKNSDFYSKITFMQLHSQV